MTDQIRIPLEKKHNCQENTCHNRYLYVYDDFQERQTRVVDRVPIDQNISLNIRWWATCNDKLVDFLCSYIEKNKDNLDFLEGFPDIPQELLGGINEVSIDLNNYHLCNKKNETYSTAIHIDSWLKDEQNIINLDEVIIQELEVQCIFTYNLGAPVVETLVKSDGITRKDIIDFICKSYQKFYREEKESLENDEGQGGNTVPVQEENSSLEETLISIARNNGANVLNRYKTFGKYRLGSYDLRDLYIESIRYHPTTNTVDFSIGS